VVVPAKSKQPAQDDQGKNRFLKDGKSMPGGEEPGFGEANNDHGQYDPDVFPYRKRNAFSLRFFSAAIPLIA
jgi:hypothetical protein